MEQCELLYMHEGVQPTGRKLSLDLVKLRSNLHQVPFMFIVAVQALFGALHLLSFLRTHIFCISKFTALSFPDRFAVLSFPELCMVFCGVIYLSRWLLKWNPAERGRWKPSWASYLVSLLQKRVLFVHGPIDALLVFSLPHFKVLRRQLHLTLLHLEIQSGQTIHLED